MYSQKKVQLEYTSRPSILYDFKNVFVKFIQTTKDSVATDKDVLEDIADEYGMRIVETNQYDIDDVGFTRSALRWQRLS